MNVEEMTLPQLQAAHGRCYAEVQRCSPEQLQAQIDQAVQAKDAANVGNVIEGTPESEARLLAATRTLEALLVEQADQARHVRLLHETIGQIHKRTSVLIRETERVNLDAGIAAAKVKLAERPLVNLTEHLADAVLVALLDGCRYEPNDINQVLHHYAGVDLKKLFDEAHIRVTEIRKGRATP